MMKKKEYIIFLFFLLGREDIGWAPGAEEKDKRRKMEQALFNSIHNDVNGRILIYDFDIRRIFHEVELNIGLEPTENNTLMLPFEL